jgi:hypothetical protein
MWYPEDSDMGQWGAGDIGGWSEQKRSVCTALSQFVVVRPSMFS